MAMKYVIGAWLALAAVIQAAGLDFPKPSQEIQAAPDATSVTANFEFTNKSGKPVSIAKSDPGCSCVSVKVTNGKLRYEPGESGVIEAVFDMTNFSGSVDKMILLWLDNDPSDKPSTILKIKVNIPVLIAMEPSKTVKWDLNGKGDPQTIRVRMAEGQTIHATSVSSSSTNFDCQLKTVEDGKLYEVVVTPKDTKTASLGVFRIDTDCKVQKQKIQQVFGVIRKPTPAEQAAKP